VSEQVVIAVRTNHFLGTKTRNDFSPFVPKSDRPFLIHEVHTFIEVVDQFFKKAAFGRVPIRQ
jgi:hypothetical protein